MAVSLKLLSKIKLNKNAKFCISSFEYNFFLTAPIEACEWPLTFSEYIVDKITENSPSNTYIGITIKHNDDSGCIPFMPLVKLTPTVFDDHFERMFGEVEKISGTLNVEVSFVSIPSCYIR